MNAVHEIGKVSVCFQSRSFVCFMQDIISSNALFILQSYEKEMKTPDKSLNNNKNLINAFFSSEVNYEVIFLLRLH